MPRYWLYLESKIQGPYEVPQLRKIPGFTLLSQVCAEGEQTWRVADDVVDIKSYFLAPPRASSVSVDLGNTAPVMQPVREPSPAVLSIIEPHEIEEPEERMPALAAKASDPEPLVVTAPAKESGGAPSLRLNCEICGYKNPRDVSSCMKCGTPLKGAGAPAPVAEKPKASGPGVSIPMPMAEPLAAVMSKPQPAAVEERALPAGSMVEIPVTRILTILAIASLLGAAGFVGYRIWQAHRRPKIVPKAAITAPVSAGRASRTASSRTRLPRSRVIRAIAASLPGVRKGPSAKAAPSPSTEKAMAKPAPADHDPSADVPQKSFEAVPYKVIEEAAPVRQRHSAPLNSPYAQKRRADRGLWAGQEDQALQQAQHYRIYGGQRTIKRNAEILMQILRDREYNSAFENGKRLYLYNDQDWTAEQKDGPVYEVRLTFSGGKESDGSPKKPLRFAFDVDLERGTVDPGGVDQMRGNTMHAFFDESRIPPEERRAIAKDTEELVLAGQPDASPLALDTVARHFVETYSTGALARVAAAYNLDLVNKKLVHDTRLRATAAAPAKDATDAPMPASSPAAKRETAVSASAKKEVLTPSSSGPIEFTMEELGGKERRVSLKAPSHATVNRLWEVMTGYDRLKQFVPDLLVSEREGQDGGAIIVHTVSLTRLMIFVFKINLHLRIIEHPAQHQLEFEKIAGEFESFRGSIQLTPDASGNAVLEFRGTVVPKGWMPSWVLRDMARKYLVNVVDAVRARAESL